MLDETTQSAGTDANANAQDVFFDYLKNDNQGGFTDLTPDTCALPFIRILQELSPQCRSTKKEFTQGAEPGMLYNSVNNRLLVSPVQLIVGKFERYFIEWKPNRGGFVRPHTPAAVQKSLAQQDHDVFYEEGSNKLMTRQGNYLQDTYIYYVVFPKYIEDGICLLCLTSTALKEARRWNSLLINTVLPGSTLIAQPYHLLWSLSTVLQSNDKGEWYGPQLNFDGFVSREQFQCITQKRQQIAAIGSVDLKALEGETDEVLEAAPSEYSKF